jgi:ABC-type multidrug transport system ATPase subunit
MTAMVRVQNLTHRFGETVALDGLDLTVAQGQCVALSGPRGAGRTTLLHLLAVLRRPSSGRIELAGIDAGRSPLAARAVTMYVGRDLPGSAHLRAHEYVDVVRRARRHTTNRAPGIATLAALHRAGIDADANVDGLSPGMRQRLALTAALAVAPPALLLDEPFALLDADGRTRFVDWLAETRSLGMTLVAALNGDVERLALCDAVLTMERGRIVSRSALDTTMTKGTV